VILAPIFIKPAGVIPGNIGNALPAWDSLTGKPLSASTVRQRSKSPPIRKDQNASELLPFWLAAFIQHSLGGCCWFIGFQLQDVKLTPLRTQ
jgi:hypothetical protein